VCVVVVVVVVVVLFAYPLPCTYLEKFFPKEENVNKKIQNV